jgi:hypothetical protein
MELKVNHCLNGCLQICLDVLQVPYDHLEFDKDFLEGKTKIEQPKTVAEVMESSVSCCCCCCGGGSYWVKKEEYQTVINAYQTVINACF